MLSNVAFERWYLYVYFSETGSYSEGQADLKVSDIGELLAQLKP